MKLFLMEVRDYLRECRGDHMVASTIFAKRIGTIVDAYENTKLSSDEVANSISDTNFAGDCGYEAWEDIES